MKTKHLFFLFLLIAISIGFILMRFLVSFYTSSSKPEEKVDESILKSAIDMETPRIILEPIFNRNYVYDKLIKVEQIVTDTLKLNPSEHMELSLQVEYMLNDLNMAKELYEAGSYDEALAYIKQSKDYALTIANYIKLKNGVLDENRLKEMLFQNITSLKDSWRILKEQIVDSFEKEVYRIDDSLAWITFIEDKTYTVLSLLNQAEYAMALYQNPSNITERPPIAFLAIGWSLIEIAKEYMEDVNYALQLIPNKLRKENSSNIDIEILISELRNETKYLFNMMRREISSESYASYVLESVDSYISSADELFTHGFKMAALFDYLNARTLLHVADHFKNNVLDPWKCTITNPPSTEEVLQAKKKAVSELEDILVKMKNLQADNINIRGGLTMLRELAIHYIATGDALTSRYLERKANWQFLGTTSKIMYEQAEICARVSFEHFVNILNKTGLIETISR